MAKKQPADQPKAWTPDSPLKVDWDKVRQDTTSANPLADKLDRSDNPLVSQGGSAKHPLNPTNHKSHIRQKKV